MTNKTLLPCRCCGEVPDSWHLECVCLASRTLFETLVNMDGRVRVDEFIYRWNKRNELNNLFIKESK